MTQGLDLRQLERKAWTSYHNDGLWEILLGLMLLPLGLRGLTDQLAWYAALPAGPVLFLMAKKHITVPRMGLVRFGPTRRRKRKMIAVIVTLSVLATLALWAAATSGAPWVYGKGVFISLGVGLWVFVLFSLMAHWMDFPRLYVIGLVLASAHATTEFLNSAIPFIAGACGILLAGLVLLRRFLRRYPLPREAALHADQ